ncbi:MAG: D-alanyl-D-alanine carboxypeptidase [Desulfobulbaceae bacterium]|nr:D-alanyl-D-alanine carboxypeptidase [Desulfobulbaceae bacterium]
MTALLLTLICCLPAATVWSAPPLEPAIDRLVTSGGLVVTLDGLVLADTRSSEYFVPASTIKVATALVTLETLGPGYRFATDIYLRGDGRLCIKGYGDPFLTTERVREISAELKARGLRRVTGLVLDDTSFALDEPADGSENSTNPYDAPGGALVVNFNALPLLKQQSGTITSPEAQLPVLPLTKEIGTQLPAGHHRVNVAAFDSPGALDTPLRYVAELFSALLRLEGIDVSGTAVRGTVGIDDKLLLRYVGPKTTAEIIRACLKHSNNYIANQLFLSAGASHHGYPATWEKARHTATNILVNRHHLPAEQFQLIEGSGLSRRTRVTPTFMIALLEAFKPYADLLSPLQGIPLKSGTMRNIYCYAGYFSQEHRLDPFVILLNQPPNTRRELLGLLHRLHQNARQTSRLTEASRATTATR